MTSTTQLNTSREARQERIRDAVLELGLTRIDDLAADLGVSAMTIHRDLTDLERQGWIRRVRGGAAAHPAARLDTRAKARLATASTEKDLIAQQALTHIERGQTIALDESTSALSLAQLLPRRAPLTVISHYRAIQNVLAGEAGVELIALGGVYHETYDAYMGHAAVVAARNVRCDLVFMSSTALVDGALFQHAPETIPVKQELLACAAYRVLLLDHTKFAKRALHRLTGLDAFDLVIVDDGIDDRGIQMLDDSGVQYEIATSTTTTALASRRHSA
jgi:DeoR/GlpR family transcriptional regulator of sugar metabolism